jgi:hypothetical protein
MNNKIDQMDSIFHCKPLENYLPKLGFLVWKCAIWQPWLKVCAHKNSDFCVACHGTTGDTQIGLVLIWSLDQGCQMVCFQTKNTNLGKFWGVLGGKMLLYVMAI